MELGIIIHTGEGFDYKNNIPHLISCVKSIRNQKYCDANIIVMCENDAEKMKTVKEKANVDVFPYDDVAKGLNDCIKQLECTHFIISRYDTIYSMNSYEIIRSTIENRCGMIFNFTSKSKDNKDFHKRLSKIDFDSQLSKFPCVWNILFDKETVINNGIKFKDFTYKDQYLFLLRFFASAEKIFMCDDVLVCLDRTLSIDFKLGYDFYKNNKEMLLGLVKELKRKELGTLLCCYIRDIALPTVRLGYEEKDERKRSFYHSMGKKFMKITG